jgi:hypothetical protein
MPITDHELLKALAEDVPDMALSVREQLRTIASRLAAAEQQRVADHCGGPAICVDEQQFIEVDGIRVDAEYVRRLRGQNSEMDFKLQKLEAEQQQQEPVVGAMEPPTDATQQEKDYCHGWNECLQKMHAGRALLYTHQQPQAQGYTVADCEALFNSISSRRMKITVGYDEEETCYAISEAELGQLEEILIGEPPEQPQAQGEPRKGWWCPTCNISPSGNDVTYQEFHQTCGTYIGDVEPPEQPRAAVPDVTTTLTDADHLAVIAEKFLSAVNQRAVAEHTCSIAETAVNVTERDQAQESVNEYRSALQEAVYEYRKRAGRYRDALAAAAPVPDDFGLRPAQEPKYSVNAEGRIFNRVSGEAIPDDEPVMIFRARDKNAAPMIVHYIKLCADEHHREIVAARLYDFIEFMHAYPERMKEPDTAAPDPAGGA